MDKERLQVLPFETLQDIATRSGIHLTEELDKDALVEQILEALEEERSDRDRSNNIEMLVKEKKFELSPDDALEYPEIEEAILPDTYGDTRVVLMLRDPAWAFAYWDLSAEHVHSIESNPHVDLILRVREVDSSGVGEVFDIPVRDGERKWYINLPKAGVRYRAELVARQGTADEVIAASNEVASPDLAIEDIPESSDIDYLSILSVAGIKDIDESILSGGVPQRIISLLDTQYLHLKG